MRFTKSAILLAAILIFSTFPALAQESQAVVVDEVVAQVNDSVITLSSLKREMKTTIDTLVQKGKTPEAAKTEVTGKQGEIIVGLINEELIFQKGKEIGVDGEVEAQVNQRFLQIMKQENLKTLDSLYKEMEKAGVKPDEIRELFRKQFAKDMVLQRDVDRRVYLGWSNKEIKDYYDQHRDKFTKPETIALSEIFLGFAGRDEKPVREKADSLVKQLRGGADFVKLALENSDTPGVAESKGSVGTFPVKELNDKIAGAVKNVKAGEVSMLETDEGIEIIRVDARASGSSESVFDENNVRTAMTYEKLPDERKKYMATLRKEAYIKIAESYRALVSPLLANDETKAEVKKASR